MRRRSRRSRHRDRARAKNAEELHHAARIVAGAPHVLQRLRVGFPFGVATELHHRRLRRDAGAELRDLRGSAVATEDRAENAEPDVRERPLRDLLGGVAIGDVGDLVRDHAGQLGLGLRGVDGAAIDPDRSARQRKRIHLAGVGHVEGVRKARTIRARRDPPAEILDVCGHRAVAQLRAPAGALPVARGDRGRSRRSPRSGSARRRRPTRRESTALWRGQFFACQYCGSRCVPDSLARNTQTARAISVSARQTSNPRQSSLGLTNGGAYRARVPGCRTGAGAKCRGVRRATSLAHGARTVI